jgi:hypothetical protein
LYFS